MTELLPFSTTYPNHSKSWLCFDDPLSTKWPVCGNAHPSAQVAKEIEIIQTLVDVDGLRSENYHQHSANVSNCGGDGSTAVVEMKDQSLAKRNSQKLGFKYAKCGFGSCNIFLIHALNGDNSKSLMIKYDLWLFCNMVFYIVLCYLIVYEIMWLFKNSALLIKPFSHSPWVIWDCKWTWASATSQVHSVAGHPLLKRETAPSDHKFDESRSCPVVWNKDMKLVGRILQ